VLIPMESEGRRTIPAPFSCPDMSPEASWMTDSRHNAGDIEGTASMSTLGQGKANVPEMA